MHRLSERVSQLREVTGGSSCCGWMIDEVAFMLYGLVKFCRPELIVQTGHLWGKSAVFALEALTDGWLTSEMVEAESIDPDKAFLKFVDEHRPSPAGHKFMTVDPNPGACPHTEAGIGLLAAWYPGVFSYSCMKSEKFFAQHGDALAAEYAGRSVMTIVDGDHTAAGCLVDLHGSARIGARVIFVDDVYLDPWLDAVAEKFAAEAGYRYLTLHLYNGVGILARN